jgi:large subunit ribosomal protein L17
VRHKKKKGKLSRTSAHRKALVRSLARELFLHERITTSAEKAKAARPVAERMITLAKKGGLANYRRAVSFLGDKTLAKKLFDSIAPRFAERPGGYTRIVRMAETRLGDNGSRAIFELVSMDEGKDNVAAD